MAFDGELRPGLEPDVFGLPFGLAKEWFKTPELPSDFLRRLGCGTLIAAGCIDPLRRRWREIPPHVWSDGLVNVIGRARYEALIGSQTFEDLRVRDPVGIALKDATRAYGSPELREEWAALARRGTPEEPIRGGDTSRRIELERQLTVALRDKLASGCLVATHLEGPDRIEIRAAAWPQVQIEVWTWKVQLGGVELRDVWVSQPAAEIFIGEAVARCVQAAEAAPAKTAPVEPVERVELPPAPPAAVGAPVQNPKRRMKRAASGYRKEDARLVEEMHALIHQGKAKGRWQAAAMVAARAAGKNTTLQAKIRRLSDRYAEKYGDACSSASDAADRPQ